MNPNTDMMAPFAARQPMVIPHTVSSPEARAEILRVQGMQVRTEAAKIAGTLMAGTVPKQQEWLAVVKVVEDYILGR